MGLERMVIRTGIGPRALLSSLFISSLCVCSSSMRCHLSSVSLSNCSLFSFLSSSLLLVFLPLLNVRVCSSAHTCHYRGRCGTIAPPTLPGHVTSSDRQLHTRAVDVMNALPVHERDLAGANAVGLQGLWFDDQKLQESPNQIYRFQVQFSLHYPSPFGMRRIIRFWVERQRRGPVHVHSLSTIEVSPIAILYYTINYASKTSHLYGHHQARL